MFYKHAMVIARHMFCNKRSHVKTCHPRRQVWFVENSLTLWDRRPVSRPGASEAALLFAQTSWGLIWEVEIKLHHLAGIPLWVNSVEGAVSAGHRGDRH